MLVVRSRRQHTVVQREHAHHRLDRAGGALQPVTMSLQRLPDLNPIGATKTEVLGEIERRIGLSFAVPLE